jgi:phage major head subunit gpT-like protein
MAITPNDLLVQESTRFEFLFTNEYNTSVAVQDHKLNPIVQDMTLGNNAGNKIELSWLGAAPQVREWVDEKRPQGINKFDWAVYVKRFEASIEVDIDAIKDGIGNQYDSRIQEMAQNASRHRYNLISELIKEGESAKCYDNQYFFDTDHDGSQSNLLSGTGTTAEKIKADFFAAKSAITGFKDDKGVPMQPVDFKPIIWIPNNPVLIQTFAELNGAITIGATSNILNGAFEIVVDPALTDTNDWYMFSTYGATKPFIYVNREPMH